MQGAGAVREAEAKGQIEEILASGRSRPLVIRDRAVGFAITLALVCMGAGDGTGGLDGGRWRARRRRSFITALACGLAALAAYGLGVLVSQLTATARAGKAVAAGLLAGLYVLTNVWEELSPAGAIRFVSPFFYFNQSRALVPGHGFDLPSSVALLAMTVVLLGAAAWAFQGRDYATGLWARRPRPRRPAQIVVPIVAAYVITQSAGWVGDLRHGRVELILARPMPWPRLVWQRLLAVLLGATAITAGAIGGLVMGALAAGAEVSWLGLLRLAADILLLTGALGAVASLMVAWPRGAAAVAVLTTLAVLGALAAAAVAHRSPKTA